MNCTIKFLFLLSFFSINFNLLGQDLANLDKKYGFNKFKLESNYNLYKDNLKYKNSDPYNDDIKFYDYTRDDDTNTLFGFFVKNINLGFYKKQLYVITIEFLAVVEDYKQKRIQYELKEIFGYQGTSYNVQASGLEYDWVLKWETNKTYLQSEMISCSSKFKACSVNIWLYSKKMRTEINNNKF